MTQNLKYLILREGANEQPKEFIKNIFKKEIHHFMILYANLKGTIKTNI